MIRQLKMLLTNLAVLLAATFLAVPLGIGSALPSCLKGQSEPEIRPQGPNYRSACSTIKFMNDLGKLTDEAMNAIKDANSKDASHEQIARAAGVSGKPRLLSY